MSEPIKRFKPYKSSLSNQELIHYIHRHPQLIEIDLRGCRSIDWRDQKLIEAFLTLSCLDAICVDDEEIIPAEIKALKSRNMFFHLTLSRLYEKDFLIPYLEKEEIFALLIDKYKSPDQAFIKMIEITKSLDFSLPIEKNQTELGQYLLGCSKKEILKLIKWDGLAVKADGWDQEELSILFIHLDQINTLEINDSDLRNHLVQKTFAKISLKSLKLCGCFIGKAVIDELCKAQLEELIIKKPQHPLDIDARYFQLKKMHLDTSLEETHLKNLKSDKLEEIHLSAYRKVLIFDEPLYTPHLKKLKVSGDCIDSFHVQELLTSASSLTVLSLDGYKTMGDISIALPSLKELSLRHSSLPLSVIKSFLKSPLALESLDLTFFQESQEGQEPLALNDDRLELKEGFLSHLKHLKLGGSDLSQEMIDSFLVSYPQLESLTLSHCQKPVSIPLGLKNLRRLTVVNSSLAKINLTAILSDSPDLEEIDFSDSFALKEELNCPQYEGPLRIKKDVKCPHLKKNNFWGSNLPKKVILDLISACSLINAQDLKALRQKNPSLSLNWWCSHLCGHFYFSYSF
ncbi:MAG: hypothetical protein ACOVOR_03600 [Rhabdochlamydiaceae bacterium]